MKKFLCLCNIIITTVLCFGNIFKTNEIYIVTTNLTDKYNTKVVVDLSTGIDLKRLNKDSQHVDAFVDKFTNIRKLTVAIPVIKPVIEITPIQKLTVNPLLRFETCKNFSTINTPTLNDFNIDFPTINTLTINDFNIDLQTEIQTSSTVNNLMKLVPISVDSQIRTAFDISNIDVQTVNVEQLISNIMSLTKFSPSVINVENKSKTCSSILVVDSSKFSIDVTDQTFSELEEMKIIYDYEQSFTNSQKNIVRLCDLQRLNESNYKKWINIFLQNKKCNIKQIKNRKIRKIIAEAWIYQNRYNSNVKQNMLKNLAFFKNKKYTAVLVRFDCTEDINLLTQMIDDIKSAGFEVFATYVGQDNLRPRWNPYIDPEVIESYISKIVPKCTGFLLNWRTTSNHVRILPIEFFNYICNTLRVYNDKILIYGEVYYGKIDPIRMVSMVYTTPENITGVVINNMGYYDYNITHIVNELFACAVPGYSKLDKLGQVIGYGPYYCSRQCNNILTIEEEYEYKQITEDLFKDTGYGTVTLSHDGVDDNYTNLIADPASSKWNDTTDNILYDTKLQKSVELKPTNND